MERNIRNLTIILVSSCLALLALAPVRLKFTAPAADQSAESETSDDEIREPCTENVPPTLDNLDHFDWACCSFGLQRIWRALNIKEDRFNAVLVIGSCQRDW